MTLILCEVGDVGAAWAAERFRQRGLPAAILTGPMLGAATRWEHRLEARSASVSITLADGRILSSDSPSPVLNRLNYIDLAGLHAAAGADYGYAVQEVYAFYLSWLNAWPATVINRPKPQGLAGPHRHASVWATLGARAGLNTLPWKQGSDDPPELGWNRPPPEATIYVVADRIVLSPALPPALAEPCRRLAALAGTELIGVEFGRDSDGRWRMTGASPTPDLIAGGEPLVEALIEALGK